MQVVTDLDAALANVAVLEEVRLGKQPSHHAAYLSLIKRGHAASPAPVILGRAVSPSAPSRFIEMRG